MSDLAHLRIRPEPIGSEVGSALVAAQWRELLSRYGVPDDRDDVTDDLAAEHLVPPDGVFLVGWAGETPVACGGVRRRDEHTVEVKRMYVVPAHRGRGYSRVVLRELETHARARGYTRVVLETGVKQPEAIALYESEGYRRIAAYGFYRDAPGSRCYGKEIEPGERAGPRPGSGRVEDHR